MSSCIQIVDNTGVKTVKLIKGLINHRKNILRTGSIHVASILESRNTKSLKRHKLCFVFIIASKHTIFGKKGEAFKYLKTSGIVLDSKFNPIGNNVLIPVLRLLRFMNLGKIISNAKIMI